MSQGKQKIRFNIVDALVLAAVILAIAGVCYQLFRTPVQQALSDNVKVTVEAVAYNNRMFLVDSALSQTLPSQAVAGNAVVPDAYLTAVTYEPSLIFTSLEDGTTVEAVDPTRFDIFFTMEMTAPRSNVAYKMGAQELRVGKTFIVKTDLLEFNGYITSVTVSELS